MIILVSSALMCLSFVMVNAYSYTFLQTIWTSTGLLIFAYAAYLLHNNFKRDNLFLPRINSIEDADLILSLAPRNIKLLTIYANLVENKNFFAVYQKIDLDEKTRAVFALLLNQNIHD